MFHICQDRGNRIQKDSFLCPNGTIFNQQYLVCDWWFNFDCADAEAFYSVNELIGQEPDPYGKPQNNGYGNGGRNGGNGNGKSSGFNGSGRNGNGNGYGSSSSNGNGFGGHGNGFGRNGNGNGNGNGGNGYGSNGNGNGFGSNGGFSSPSSSYGAPF